MSEPTPTTTVTHVVPAASVTSPGKTEKTWWWVAFGVLTLSILVMLGAWN